DTIEGGGGSDTIEGGDGDDSLTGGDDASDSNLFLDWSAVGADGRDITGGFTQDTGGIKVTVDYTNDGNATGFNVESTTSQYVGAGDPFDPNSSGILYGGGNTGDTSTVTMDFEAVNGSGYDDEVRDVSFRINDIDQYRDGSGWDDKVTIRAYDADGNLLPITITYQGITTTSTEPSVGGNANYGSTSEGGSMLIEIAGPVARIEVDYDQTGNSGQLIFISDVHFTAHATDDGDDDIKGGAGADSIKGMAGNDTLDGGTGADLVDGGTGDDLITVDQGDTVSGGEGDDFFTLEDLDTTGTGNDSISIDGGSGDEKGGDTLRLTPDVKRSDITFTDSDPDGGYAGYFTMADGTVVHFKNIENIICFTPGTRILTEVGERPVETLRLGDRVVTRDSGVQPIRWIGTRTVPGRGRFAPVHVASSVLDGSRSGLVVSPQHRLLFTGYQAELLFGESEVLVPAKHLIDGMDVTRVEQEEVTYIHLMFDHHEIIYAEGIATESFHAGDIGLTALCEEAREELFALFPELRSAPQTLGDTARPCLRAYEAKLLRESFTGAWS
ncbi:MAG: Hint domain-containing protein, partial [Roseovarius sp.]